MQREVRQSFAVDFVQRTDRITHPCRGFIGFPVGLLNRVLCSDEPTRLCLATRNVWALAPIFPSILC
jgi:hypothetical protein